MKSRFPWCCTAKYVALATSLVILSAWGVSTQRVFGDSMGNCIVLCGGGVCWVLLGYGDSYEDTSLALSSLLSPHRYGFCMPDSCAVWGARAYILPLWMPFLVAASVTLVFFRWDRRRVSPESCRSCGYNLTANSSGICPECGATVPAEQRQLVSRCLTVGRAAGWLEASCDPPHPAKTGAFNVRQVRSVSEPGSRSDDDGKEGHVMT
jgi:hypothetical protein